MITLGIIRSAQVPGRGIKFVIQTNTYGKVFTVKDERGFLLTIRRVEHECSG